MRFERVAAALGAALLYALPASAAPGMTWAEERAWLQGNRAVDAATIQHGFDSDLNVNVATADLKTGRKWKLRVILTRADVVTEETFSPAKGEMATLEEGNRASQRLLRRMYGAQSEVVREFASASQVAVVPVKGGNQQFFALKGGQYGFMLDAEEVVIFRAGELNERISQAKYCSTHPECS